MEREPLQKYLITFAWIAFGISLLIFAFLTPVKDLTTYLRVLGVSFLYTFGYGAGNLLMNHYLNRWYSWVTETRKRVVAAIAGTLLLNVALTLLLNYISYVLVLGTDPQQFFSPEMNFTHWAYLNIALLVATFLHARGFVKILKKDAEKKVTTQKIIASTADARFESLKNQLDPHFLFNSLNTLSALIEEDSAKAQNFTDSLSGIYRYILEKREQEVVPLSEETDFAKDYIGLLKYRFEESLNFKIDLKTEDLQGFIVPLSLQMLLENCVKHNLATSAKPLVISISREGNFLTIKNNLQLREKLEQREGIGLANIAQRYALLTPRKIEITQDEQSYTVKIPILTEKNKIMENYSEEKDRAYQRAISRAKELKGFYGNLIAYCCVIPFLAILNYLTGPEDLWFYWPALGWGLGVAIHALNTFGLGKGWEERKAKEIMEKEKRNPTWK